MTRPVRKWGLKWRSRNRLDGQSEHIICEHCFPKMFDTRAEARAYANDRYGYIKRRPDLQVEPHGWRMPQPVRLRVEIDQ